MFHIIPFAVGVATGAALLKLLKSDKTQEGLDKAQGDLREATVSSLQAIERASARARARLGEKAETRSGDTPVGEAPPPSEEQAATARAAAEPATGAQGAQGGTGSGEHYHWTASESLENLEGGRGERAP
ncbi:hypothetical protein [Azorhizophilus paspali]|uniref:Uncharacterized protein n=1 Tax=Azorhizophilus paspali TaxID=69963 RepID=A0ABV6SR47_AZOPA